MQGDLKPGTDEFNAELFKEYKSLLLIQNTPIKDSRHNYKCKLCRDTGFNWEIETVERVPQLVAITCRACKGMANNKY